MSTLKNQVAHLLSLDVAFRDNDKLLWLKLAESEGLILTKAQRFIFMGLPSESSVSRRRRELRGRFPESPRVREHRYSHFKKMTDEFSDQSHLVKFLRKIGI